MSTDAISEIIVRLETFRRGRPRIERGAVQDIYIPRDLMDLTIALLYSILNQRRQADEPESRTQVAEPRSNG